MKKVLVLFVLPVVLVLTGCGPTAKFVYPDNPQNLIKIVDQPKYDVKVGVIPLDEMRNSKNSCAFWLYAIPICPAGFAEYERPDAAKSFLSVVDFEFDVSEDLAKAVVASAKKSGLFKDCFFTYGGEKDSADIIIGGEVLSTKYKGCMMSYGLSVFGPLLWYVGAPAGSSENFLKLRLIAKDRSGKVIWEYTSEKSTKVTQGLYYNMGHDVRGYSPLMEKIMNEALPNLDKALQSQQATLKQIDAKITKG